MDKEHLERFARLNDVAKNNAAVLFGSDFFAEFPVNELALDFGMDVPVYNRSVPGLRIADAEKVLQDCVFELEPAKVFINIGDADLKQGDIDVGDFLSAYEWLLYTIHSHSNARIYIVSVCSASPLTDAVNRGLQRIAEASGCAFIDINRTDKGENRETASFRRLKTFLRDKPFTFADAF